MKICFIAPANNYHTKKWANWFLSRGHEIHIISFIKDEIPGVSVHYIETGVSAEGSDASKLKYLFKARKLKKIIDSIQPDVVNVHYASSYGAVAALSGIKHYVLSVWGSDIYDFPRKSPLHRLLLKYSLKKAEILFSTSHSMAAEAAKYTNREFEITPFGVDMDLFNPNKRTREKDIPFTIGIVKTLSDLYGIDYLIKAVAILKKEKHDFEIALRISGDGPQEEKYRKQVKDLGIENITTFLGRITQEKAACEWANMDVAVIPSMLYESFGVSAVEAQACGTPLIITDVEGLMETTTPGVSSELVSKKDEQAIADAIVKLYNNPDLRRRMGEEGRNNVVNKYELDKCFKRIENYFEHFIQIGD